MFEQHEAQAVLHMLEKLNIESRKIELNSLLCRPFEDMMKLDFFGPLWILNGKSICDLCLSDPNAIRRALQTLKKEKTKEMKEYKNRSAMYLITEKDEVRRAKFR